MEFYSHQLSGIEFLADKRHAINSDDMGLGKTLENLYAVELNECWRVLIICLNSNKYTWAEEIERYFPGNDIIIVGGKKSDKFDDREEQIKAGARFTIINYDLVGTLTKRKRDDLGTVVSKTIDLRHRLSLVKEKWDAVIISEAHRVRNRTSKAFRGIDTILTHSKPRVVIAETGTPIYTKVDNLWPLLHFVDRKRFSSFYAWAENHCHIKLVPFSPYPKVDGIKNIPELKASLSDIMLRRMKEDVLDLPPRTFVDINVDLDEKHRRIYDKLARDLYVDLTWDKDGGLELESDWQLDPGAIQIPLEDYDPEALKTINVVNVVSLIQRHRQIAVSADLLDPNTEALTGAKIDAVLELVDGIGDQKVVIFSQFAQAIRRLHPILTSKLNIRGLTLTGKTKVEDRPDRVRRFQEDDVYRFIGATYMVGGTGYTLTAGSIVICLDLMWSPGDNNQGIDRVSRIGQTKPVTVYNINARNTIEDKVRRILGGREKLFDEALPRSEIIKIFKAELSAEARAKLGK